LTFLGITFGSENAVEPRKFKHWWVLRKIPKRFLSIPFQRGFSGVPYAEMPQLAVSPEEVSANEGRPRWRCRPSHPDPRSTGSTGSTGSSGQDGRTWQVHWLMAVTAMTAMVSPGISAQVCTGSRVHSLHGVEFGHVNLQHMPILQGMWRYGNMNKPNKKTDLYILYIYIIYYIIFYIILYYIILSKEV